MSRRSWRAVQFLPPTEERVEGAVLRTLRLCADVTQSNVAQAAGIRKEQVSALERGAVYLGAPQDYARALRALSARRYTRDALERLTRLDAARRANDVSILDGKTVRLLRVLAGYSLRAWVVRTGSVRSNYWWSVVERVHEPSYRRWSVQRFAMSRRERDVVDLAMTDELDRITPLVWELLSRLEKGDKR